MPARTVAIAGLGAIGLDIARQVDDGIDGLGLMAVASRDRQAAAMRMADFRNPPPVSDLPWLARADIVVEALPAALFDEIALPAIDAGKTLIACSVGALLSRQALFARARETGGQIIVPSGALGGLDAVRALCRAPVSSVTLETRKPPASLAGAPALADLDLAKLTTAVRVFRGNARQAAEAFPANANVAAALALAGIGPERTMVEIWADPAATRNTHSVRLVGEAGDLTLTLQNVPSPSNPRTSRLAALSVVECLAGLAAAVRIGT